MSRTGAGTSAPADRGIAAAQVDAYLWLGRPWMVNAGPFSLRYALTLGANGLY